MLTSNRLDFRPYARSASVTISNRRVRTRTHGGVAGVGGQPPPLCRSHGAKPCYLCRRKPREQWLALIPGAHEGYVSWEEFERIAGAIRENLQGEHQHGAVKNGQALLTGLLRCAR